MVINIYGQKLKSNRATHRGFVGPPGRFDSTGALQFDLLINNGLKKENTLLDIGCGSLRAGKLFIPYLASGNYYGIEPEKWLLEKGIKHEIDKDIIKIKKPNFDNNHNFNLGVFNVKFDYILAQGIFCHTCPAQMDKCLSETDKVLSDKGMFFLNYALGKKERFETKWKYPEYNLYTEDFIASLILKNGLKYENIKWEHPDRRMTWIKIYKDRLLINKPA